LQEYQTLSCELRLIKDQGRGGKEGAGG